MGPARGSPPFIKILTMLVDLPEVCHNYFAKISPAPSQKTRMKYHDENTVDWFKVVRIFPCVFVIPLHESGFSFRMSCQF